MSLFRIRTQRGGVRDRLATLLVAAALFALAIPAASARDEFEVPNGPIMPHLPEYDWRAAGLAFVDLPLGIRARVDAAYRSHLYSSERLALPFVYDFGPGIRRDQTLESRIALSRPIAAGIELEIAWESRNSLATSDPLGFGRQTIGARIRIAP
jgi:hypothetical protein